MIEILGWIFLAIIVVIALCWTTGRLQFVSLESVEKDCKDKDKPDTID